MRYQLSPAVQILKATKFWRENRLLLREFKHFRWIALVALICTLLGAFFEGATVGLIASFLQGLTNPNEPPIQTGIEWFDVTFLATKAAATARIYRISGLILVAVWLRSGLLYLGQFYSKLSGLHLGERLRERIFEQLQSFSLSYYSKTKSGELINSITSEVYQVQQAFEIASQLITKGSTLLAYVASMFWLSWQLSTAAVLLYILLSVGLSNLIARIREASFEVPKANGKFSSVVIEFINGIRTVRASATQDFERRKFDCAIAQVMNAKSKMLAMSSLVQPLAQGVSTTILIVMIIVAFHLFVVDGELRAASLLTFMFVLFRMMPLVSQLNGSREKFSSLQGFTEQY